MNQQSAQPLFQPNRLSWGAKLPSLSSLLVYIFIIWLIFAFVSGITLKFYASILFTFYALVKHMWIAVVCLGVFQTLLLIPFRIVKVKHSQHIKEFVDNISNIKDLKLQRDQYSEQIKKGRRSALFYSLDFFVQLVSYTSMGRLFLTDFYSKQISSNLLYSFVPYPDYPIRDILFKIPYPYFTSTQDFGMKPVLIIWVLILVSVLALRFLKYSQKSKFENPAGKQLSVVYAQISGQIILLGIIAWLLVRYFPTGWKLGIFSGDISIPNPTFNAITALATFLLLMWFGINNMYRKSKLAKESGIPEIVINATEKEMFRNMVISSGLIGLGAFFITNQIPSAFELSIFTLEIISLLSPLTLDKIITSNVKVPAKEEPPINQFSEPTKA